MHNIFVKNKSRKLYFKFKLLNKILFLKTNENVCKKGLYPIG